VQYEQQKMAPAEVPMVEPEVVRQIRELRGHAWGTRRIARALGVSRTTVRRYVTEPTRGRRPQVRPRARQLDDAGRAAALRLFEGDAQQNAVVVVQLLRAQGIAASARVVQRVVAARRRALTTAQLATVRFETAPGHQLQIDFGQQRLQIGDRVVIVHVLVAVLSYSRRLFVQAFLSECGDDWRDGIAAALRHFGGVPRTILGDNARALVVAHDRQTQTVTFHPAYLAFCRDWDLTPRACGPYRARTKGKTEAGVKYVKHNALAGRAFASFAALEAHLQQWMRVADQRVHGTTHESPAVRFARDEARALRPLPAAPLAPRGRRVTRRVALDAIRYSVPHGLVRDHVEVQIGERQVRIYHGLTLVATHDRSREPHARIIDTAHFAGLWRVPAVTPPSTPAAPSPLEQLGRSLRDYAAVIEQGAR
jgi:transposase